MLARVRSDAPLRTGARRRVSSVCEDDVAHVLRLQRTIGNRATTRLLREPVADVEQEWARFEAAKQTHQQRLAEYAARDKPHVLKQQGITTDSRVASDTPKWIQAALAESQLLRPYLKKKFPASAITDGKFTIESNEDVFNTAAKDYLGNKDNMTKEQRAAAFGGIGGYYDRRDHSVHVRSRTKFGHAVHESMHKVASPGFHIFWGTFINEGVTQYFTDLLLEEQGLSKVTDHKYGAELACAEKLVAATSWQVVAGAYFLEDGTLRETLMKRFKLDLLGLKKELIAERVCARL